ncbi:MAG TPA: hypothetical protein VHK88_12205 [Aquihabitans sp.]|jgi:hypothetical protein|nr:hypothetical protein [Aquihabitans sp.]
MNSVSGAGDVADRMRRPPVRLLWFSAAFAALAVFAHVPAIRMANLVGYVSGTILTISAVAAFRRVEARESADPWYAPEPGLRYVAVAVLVVGLAAAGCHIWYLSEVRP